MVYLLVGSCCLACCYLVGSTRCDANPAPRSMNGLALVEVPGHNRRDPIAASSRMLFSRSNGSSIHHASMCTLGLACSSHTVRLSQPENPPTWGCHKGSQPDGNQMAMMRQGGRGFARWLHSSCVMATPALDARAVLVVCLCAGARCESPCSFTCYACDHCRHT